MKIAIYSIGKPNEPYVRSGIEDFSKRISNYFKLEWELIAPIKNQGKLGIDDTKKAEGELILAKLHKDDFLVALEERGNQLSSEGLANMIQTCANSSVKKIVFLIGGAFGLHGSVLQRANYQWSLSKLVFPHQLVRLILAEQLYRACTIMRNEKYHHQ